MCSLFCPVMCIVSVFIRCIVVQGIFVVLFVVYSLYVMLCWPRTAKASVRGECYGRVGCE